MSKPKNESPSEKQSRLFREFIQNKRIMIVDSQATARATLAQTLVKLGANISQITLDSQFNSANGAIAENSPDILISEFDLEGGKCGLDLLAAQRKVNNQSKNSLFILITGNTSQAAVARAAEEDVDGFIIKPYTLDGLRISLMKYAMEKAYPPKYFTVIEKGKAKLATNEIDEALKYFKQAMTMEAKPSLAYFYHGLAEETKKLLTNAEKDYSKGLSFNKIHYKCMVALFDLYMSQNRNKDAYEVVRKISRCFPANPDRLATVLRLAVINEEYDDIEKYYQSFCRLDYRNEILTRYVCAALIVCGKSYLQRRANSRAIDLFKKAKATGASNPFFLKEIILNLLQFNLVKEATEFLKAYPAEHQGKADYKGLQYAVEDGNNTPSISITKGRKLLQDGVREYVVYSTLIARLLEVGHEDQADELIIDATKLWPAKGQELLLMVQELTGQKKIA